MKAWIVDCDTCDKLTSTEMDILPGVKDTLNISNEHSVIATKVIKIEWVVCEAGTYVVIVVRKV